MAPITRPSSIAALVIIIIAASAPALYRSALPYLTSLSPHLVSYSSSILKTFGRDVEQASSSSSSFSCIQHTYTTEIISLDPLLIYIDSFLAPAEVEALLEAGELEFAPSRVYKRGRNQGTSDRTSSSAGLPRDNPAVQCVLERAEGFLGTMLDPSRDDIGPPQLVRYTAGQRFNRHRDWYERPQPARKGMGRGKSWNRIASFFAILQDQCTGGETWFPLINTTVPSKADGKGRRFWKTHEDGGLAFRPVAGNALFWVNLFANGTGDDRTIHAGLPVEEGLKTAMNIWPRKFYG
ncbi:uncharacterized protein F4807DRAFT_329483 [Annulohypoxylon truncatum]|uniref:uncharacterized protein n=1 Tax=Annulohypoxylon truncatum TaxID=327061 RepID=UPI0020087C36|nr:uncharacterized protein F4807DRAFT_329483 [Annulohypoxylon truncatum]KAI1204553.1 hypothetical protein F4807DRAFT_329483 [Annulohypoxylon truncatum]